MWQKNIQILLREKDMTQEELAIDANLSQSSISAYISGTKTPSIQALLRIAKALDTTLAELFSDEPVELRKVETNRLKDALITLINSADHSQLHSLNILLSVTQKFLR